MNQPEQTASDPVAAKRRQTIQRLLRFLLARVVRTLALLIGAYAIMVLLGMIPINRNFVPTADGVELYFSSNAVHTDIVVPVVHEVIDWRTLFAAEQFRGDISRATHVAIGWGDEGFFIDTPTWADLRFSTAMRALFWPTETCVHVTFMNADDLANDPSSRSVRVSRDQYQQLVEFIRQSFQRDAKNRFVPIAGAHYGQDDAFYSAVGYYHCFNTCNSWAGKAMQASGIRVGWFTPLPRTIFLHLPD